MDTLSQQLATVRQRVKTLEAKGRGGLPRDEQGRIRLPGDVVIGDPTQGVVLVPGRPDPPEGVVATPGAFADRVFVDIEWEARPDVVGYEVVLRRVSTSTVDVKQPPGTSVRFDGLAPNEEYGVIVYSRDTFGRVSNPTVEVLFDSGQDTTDPSQVDGVTATAGLRTVMVRWDDVPDVDVANGLGWYEVEVYDDESVLIEDPRRVAATIVAFADLTVGERYGVRVRAIDTSANVGPWSEMVYATAGKVAGQDVDVESLVNESTLTGLLVADQGFIAELVASDVFIGNLEVDIAKVNGDLTATRISSGRLESAQVVISEGGSLQVSGSGSARLFIDESGIRLWNTSNQRTLFANADTGDLELRGTLVAGSVMTDGSVVGTTITGGLIAGAVVQGAEIIGTRFRTSTSGARVQIDDSNDRVTFFNESGEFTNLRQGNTLGLETSGSMRIGGVSDPQRAGGTLYCARAVAFNRLEAVEIQTPGTEDTRYLQFTTSNSSNTTTQVRVVTNNVGDRAFEPIAGQNGDVHLGRAGRRWLDVWAANGVIQTSDLRAKPGHAPLDRVTAAGLARDLALVSWPDRDSGKTHVGFDAHQVRAAGLAAGLDLAAIYVPDDPDDYLGLAAAELLPLLAAWIGDVDARLQTVEAA